MKQRLPPVVVFITLFALDSGANAKAIESNRDVFLVDDYHLAYQCAGEGAPVIFLEPPSGISAEQAFKNIYPEIARSQMVCQYERLGFGASDPVPERLNQTTKDYASELHTLVKQVAPDDDIVIVGYSFGGFVARYYASRYPDRVKGLLLIDAAHERWIQDMKEQMAEEDWRHMQDILDWYQVELGHNYWDSQFEVADTSLNPELPIRIVSRGLDYQRIRQADISEDGFRIYNDLHDKYQAAQEHLSSNTVRTIAENSEHLIVESEPEIVLAALHDLLSAIEADN